MAKKKVFQISNALTEGLEETINAAQNYSGALRIEIIPIKKIEADPDNPRDLSISLNDVLYGLQEGDPNRDQKMEELSSLQTIANSIRDQGIINPIVVYKQGEKYRLVAGERRTLASVLAGKSDIQAKILDSKPHDLKISLLQWIENVERSDLSLWERLKNLEKIVQLYSSKKNINLSSITITEISDLIGCSKPHALNYKAVLLAGDQVISLIRENKIKNLEKAALIANTTSPAVQNQLITACLLGASLKKLRVMADQQNKAKSTQGQRNVTERRGRQTRFINLGVTRNVKVAKAILEGLFQSKDFSHIPKDHFEIDWKDFKSINELFKELIKHLEALHT